MGNPPGGDGHGGQWPPQQGYPQQGQPQPGQQPQQAYPQQGQQPQQAYPQQGQQPQQGYPQQQGGFGPPGGAPTGHPPAGPTKPKSKAALFIGLGGGALALVAIIVGVAVVAGGDEVQPDDPTVKPICEKIWVLSKAENPPKGPEWLQQQRKAVMMEGCSIKVAKELTKRENGDEIARCFKQAEEKSAIQACETRWQLTKGAEGKWAPSGKQSSGFSGCPDSSECVNGCMSQCQASHGKAVDSNKTSECLSRGGDVKKCSKAGMNEAFTRCFRTCRQVSHGRVAESAAPATPTSRTDTARTARPASPSRRTDGWSFLGFRYGDDKAKVIAKLGPPTKTEPSTSKIPFQTLRYADKVNVTVHAKIDKIYTLNVSTADGAKWLRDKGIDDPRLNILGMHRDEVFELYGKPKNTSPGNHVWEYEDGDKRGQLAMTCYEFNEYICRDITVSWFSGGMK
jgi:hypothetical protein